MNVLIWILILSFFVLSFIALIYPVFPSITAIWAAFLLYHFGFNTAELTSFFWLMMGLFTVLLILADIFASALSVKQYGGSELGKRVGGIAVILGAFIYPPIGLVLVPFIAVFLAEWVQKRTLKEASQAAFGSVVGFLSGQIATALIQLLMIAWFFLTIWF